MRSSYGLAAVACVAQEERLGLPDAFGGVEVHGR